MAIDRAADDAGGRGDVAHSGVGVLSQHVEGDVEDAIACLVHRARTGGLGRHGTIIAHRCAMKYDCTPVCNEKLRCAPKLRRRESHDRIDAADLDPRPPVHRLDLGSEIDDLKQRLARTRWPDPETVGDWSQGVRVENARSLVDYWEHGYDWRRFESELNRFPQFLTEIDGLDIHFIHVRSEESQRDAADPHARMAGLDRGIPEADRPADRSGCVRRRGRRLLRRRHPVAPRFGFSGSPPRPGGPSPASQARGRS